MALWLSPVKRGMNEMTKHKLLKKFSIGIVSLALIFPLAMSGLNNTNVNARRRKSRTHRVYRHHRKARRRKSRKTPNLASYNNYGKYEVKITRSTKLTYEKRSFAYGTRTLRSRWIHKGTILHLSGHNSVYDGPTYVVYGRHSFGNHGNKLSVITLTHHNYKFIRRI